MKLKTLPLLIAAALVSTPLFAAEGTAMPSATENLATINGKPVSIGMFQISLASAIQKTGQPNSPALQNQVFNDLVKVVVGSEEAKRLKLDEQPQVQAAIDLQQMQVLFAALADNYMKKAEVSEEEIKKAYDEAVAKAEAQKEYKARHILVKDEAKAKELIKQLDDADGAGFEDLARDNSEGPTAKTGGDLGWFAAGQMVAPFSAAVAALDKGSYTKEPVKTDFGWHVILLEDVRSTKAPPLEKVRDKIEMGIRRQKATEELSKLVEKAELTDLNEIINVKKKEQ